jgi:hypothetical protein
MATPEQIALDTTGTTKTEDELAEIARDNDCTVEAVVEVGGIVKCPGCGYWVFEDTMLAGYCGTCVAEEYNDEF